MAKITQFINECQEELKKVTWPEKEELKGSVWVVIVSVLILTALVYGFDYVYFVSLKKFIG